MKNRNKKTNNNNNNNNNNKEIDSKKKKKININNSNYDNNNSIVTDTNPTDSTTDIYLYTSSLIFKFTQYTNAGPNALAFSWEATRVNTINNTDNLLKCMSEGIIQFLLL